MADASTIFALSSGAGRAGVAVIRVSGAAAQTVIDRMAAPVPKPRQVVFRTVRHPATGEPIDKAVVFWFVGPASETGEDVAELQLHGGRAVVHAALDALGTIEGCRLAEPGEFARRAFLNGKLDLAQVEGLSDLVDAETDAQRRQALAQAGGALSKLYEDWRTRLIAMAGLAEAAIDFADEGDVGAGALEQARNLARPLKAEIAAHLNDGRRGEIVRDGFRVALLGPPNAGKSSLLNALARREAAIVSAEAGTTRDVVEVRLELAGYPVIVSDTAGLRASESAVEREGVRRSMAAADAADLVLWLSETGQDVAPLEISRETSLDVRTKADLSDDESANLASPLGERRPRSGGEGAVNLGGTATVHPLTPTLSSRGEGDAQRQPLRAGGDVSLSPWGEAARQRGEGAVAISAKTGYGLDRLVALLAERCRAAVGDDEQPALTQARHRQALERAAEAINDFIEGDSTEFELRAEDVRRAASAIGRITGRVDVEDVLDQIFSRFCIGK